MRFYNKALKFLNIMDVDLKNKNALVCGSSKGIGKAAAITLAQLGANVTLVARSATVMADLVKNLDNSQGQKHDFLQADFTNSTDLKRKITGLTAGKTIHILVNNTGGPPAGPVNEALVEEFQQAFHNHHFDLAHVSLHQFDDAFHQLLHLSVPDVALHGSELLDGRLERGVDVRALEDVERSHVGRVDLVGQKR